MTELKPCPFCGGKAHLRQYDDAERTYYYAYCKCGARTSNYIRKHNAIRAWNKRPNPWHTGTPTEEGVYLCASENEFRRYGLAYWDGEGFHSEQVGMIVKWQKIEEK